MGTTKVKSDVHGLYVRTDGQVYRPVRTPYGYTISHVVNSREDGTSAFAEGEAVRARHGSGTPFCVVRARDVEEYWHGHGVYIGKKSEECWTPVDNGHEFVPAARLGFREGSVLADKEVCARCGIVKRLDGHNSPCKGRVRVALRDAGAPDGLV
ncbi:TPA: hypothetical protein QDB04_002244 [Burkholderia vietnamiensis]|nr:hypothetical protein [Burkholderia vietnamiensis]